MDEQARYEEAKKRVEEIKGFYLHLVSYIVVNLVLLAINLLTSPEHLWFFWPLAGWGIGLVLHAFTVFSGLWGKSWEERKIKEIMEKNKPRNSE
jgi:uncharacterized membrane protein